MFVVVVSWGFGGTRYCEVLACVAVGKEADAVVQGIVGGLGLVWFGRVR